MLCQCSAWCRPWPVSPTGFPSSSEKESVVDLFFLLLGLGFINSGICFFFLKEILAYVCFTC